MSVLCIDLETGPAEQLYAVEAGFIRLAGYAIDGGPVRITTDMTEVCDAIRAADLVYAHNAIAFDLAALEHHHGLDVGTLVEAGRVRDTLLLARQAWPPLSGPRGLAADGRGYTLDDVAARLDVAGKLAEEGESVLKRLAARHGGYDRIPVDDPQYRAYLEQDVHMLREVAQRLPVDRYLLREHRVMWRLQHISRVGFRVGTEELARRQAQEQRRGDELRARFCKRHSVPSTSAAPQRTTAGKAAIEAALRAAGVEPPRTARGGLATGSDALTTLAEQHLENEAVVEMCEMLQAMNGRRSTVETLVTCTRPDGRVHPSVSARQASGRISVTEPGLTTMGKRARRNALERALLLPDEGDVLLCVDLSQIDARAMAVLAQDPAYLEAFQPGRDLHSENAERILGDRARRSDAKALAHAINYGQGARALAGATGQSEGEARGLLARLDQAYPQLAAFKRGIREQAEHGHVLTSAFGRRMSVQVGREYTQAPAMAGQGTARDLMMEGVLRLPAASLPRLRAIVHDEIVLSVPASTYGQCRAEVLAALTFDFTPWAGATPVPVLAETGAPGLDWADCYRDEHPEWPEMARTHREQPGCDDSSCTWHGPGGLMGS